MAEIYFDNSATTPLCQSARKKMCEVMDSLYGNPSSMHSKGVDAEKVITRARGEILDSLGVKNISTLGDNRLIFTSSGTEADNLALFGTCHAKKFTPGKNIVISDSEHPAVLECAKKLEEDGIKVTKISTKNGVFDYDSLEAALDKNTVIVSVMLVNNETGAVNDIKRISRIVKSKNPEALVHTDAVQGFMKIKFTPMSLGADLITLSSHKIHGPKGVGALYVDPAVLKARKLVPIIYGGGQEKGLRSGTENTVGIAGFGAAAAECSKSLIADIKNISDIQSHIRNTIETNSDYKSVKLNIPEGVFAPHIVSINLGGIKSETMLHFLSARGIYVSSGSACSSNSGHISNTLLSFGLTEREADSTIRVSLGRENTKEEADIFLNTLLEGVNNLISTKNNFNTER
ncbi:MAG: cysteine desulfurase [Ruminococcaceae bacterium]|nr:cysteine desulfurase [Oscillospiraceae bacterium]